MSSKEKLIKRFCRFPSDFTFEELTRLFGLLGYVLDSKGVTSGSRVSFSKGKARYCMHKPHPRIIVRKTILKDIYLYLSEQGLL